MTNKEAIKILSVEKELHTLQLTTSNDNHYEKIQALDMAIKALKQTSVLDQIKWERDIAISQLKDLGYGLGEKPRMAEWEIVGNNIISCSNCECFTKVPSNYCPNCGAKMKKEREEEE
jgi:hypothetical protein